MQGSGTCPGSLSAVRTMSTTAKCSQAPRSSQAIAAWKQQFGRPPDAIVLASNFWDLARVHDHEPGVFGHGHLPRSWLEGWQANFTQWVEHVRTLSPQVGSRCLLGGILNPNADSMQQAAVVVIVLCMSLGWQWFCKVGTACAPWCNMKCWEVWSCGRLSQSHHCTASVVQPPANLVIPHLSHRLC